MLIKSERYLLPGVLKASFSCALLQRLALRGKCGVSDVERIRFGLFGLILFEAKRRLVSNEDNSSGKSIRKFRKELVNRAIYAGMFQANFDSRLNHPLQ